MVVSEAEEIPSAHTYTIRRVHIEYRQVEDWADCQFTGYHTWTVDTQKLDGARRGDGGTRHRKKELQQEIVKQCEIGDVRPLLEDKFLVFTNLSSLKHSSGK